MFNHSLIAIENHIAQQTLQSAVNHPEVKALLFEAAIKLIESVLIPLRRAITDAGSYSALSRDYQKAFYNLAAELSLERHQHGAVLPEIKTSNEILGSAKLMHHMLDECERCLLQLRDIHSVAEILRVLKVIIQLAYVYHEGPAAWHGEEFAAVSSLVTHTKEESDIRITRPELGEAPMLALTTGIGQEQRDLALASEGKGYYCGKSHFGAVGMRARLQLLCQQYDKTKLPLFAEALLYYRIPLEASLRKDFNVYVTANETWFEKLARDPVTKQSHPLVASYSHSMSRSLVVMQDFKFFNTPEGRVDLNKAQLFANCILAFLIHAGHHSFFEAAEAYNRFIDYIALKTAPLPAPENGCAEELLPYYRVGSYSSFFHRYLSESASVDSPVCMFCRN